MSKWRNVHRRKLPEVQFITSAMYHSITLFVHYGSEKPNCAKCGSTEHDLLKPIQ